MIQAQLVKRYSSGQNFVLELDLTLNQGQVCAIMGPSGSGKTTLLQLISGLLEPDQGIIKSNEEVWFDGNRKINLAAGKRSLGYVFQEFSLFPTLSIEENIKYAGCDDNEALQLLNLVGLRQYGKAKPYGLSGGQKQKASLARSLVQKPKILLLDEPFSALDDESRRDMQNLLIRVRQQENLTILLVSHDIGEIVRLCDRVIELKDGKIINDGKPLEVFSNTYTSGKFQFLGEVLDIAPADTVFVVTILAQNQVIKVVALRDDLSEIEIGSKVVVSSKAFNPIIHKVT